MALQHLKDLSNIRIQIKQERLVGRGGWQEGWSRYVGGWVSVEQSVLSLKTEIEISNKDVGKNNTETPRGTTMLSGIKITEIAMLTLTIACNKQLAKKFKWPFKSSNWHIEELIIRYCDILWPDCEQGKYIYTFCPHQRFLERHCKGGGSSKVEVLADF